MRESEPIIRLMGVSFSYDGIHEALSDISFEIAPGEFICVLGSNGSGKSTLIKQLNGLLLPDSGEVFVKGISIFDTRRVLEFRSMVSLVFQNPIDQLVASYVEDDVAFGPENLGVARAEIRRRVSDVLQAVGLSGYEKREVSSLSLGEAQRVCIAGALAMQPLVLVLDEPTSLLDPQGKRDVCTAIAKCRAFGMTVVMVTHDLEEAIAADRIFVLHEGRLVCNDIARKVLIDADSLHAWGLYPPSAVRISCALRSKGCDIPMCLSEDELIYALAEDHSPNSSPLGS